MGLSGTLIAGVMYAGDDAVAWLDAGYTVRKVDVRCSARIAAGTDTLPPDATHALCAIDCNGLAPVRVHSIVSVAGGAEPFDVRYGVGHHNGEQQGDVLAMTLHASELIDVHNALTANLPGFGCFAILLDR